MCLALFWALSFLRKSCTWVKMWWRVWEVRVERGGRVARDPVGMLRLWAEGTGDTW